MRRKGSQSEFQDADIPSIMASLVFLFFSVCRCADDESISSLFATERRASEEEAFGRQSQLWICLVIFSFPTNMMLSPSRPDTFFFCPGDWWMMDRRADPKRTFLGCHPHPGESDPPPSFPSVNNSILPTLLNDSSVRGMGMLGNCVRASAY